MSTSATARRKARQKAAPQPATTPEPELSCEVCHIPGTEETLENRGGENVPYWMCPETETPECNKRAGIVRPEAPADDEPQSEDVTAEETAGAPA